MALQEADTGKMGWTILRPCHIYGPGSQLGCLPEHGRDPQLINRLRMGEVLRLVGGGHFLQQPILARDLSETIISVVGNPAANQKNSVAGPILWNCENIIRLSLIIGGPHEYRGYLRRII